MLLNAGNLTRVVSQPLADFVGGSFFVTMGVSGFVEVAGLALFGYNLWRTMDAVEGPVSVDFDVPITPRTLVAVALRRAPDAVEILAAYGFTQLRNPVARRMLARAVTLEQAAHVKGLAVEEIVARLAAARPGRRPYCPLACLAGKRDSTVASSCKRSLSPSLRSALAGSPWRPRSRGSGKMPIAVPSSS